MKTKNKIDIRCENIQYFSKIILKCVGLKEIKLLCKFKSQFSIFILIFVIIVASSWFCRVTILAPSTSIYGVVTFQDWGTNNILCQLWTQATLGYFISKLAKELQTTFSLFCFRKIFQKDSEKLPIINIFYNYHENKTFAHNTNYLKYKFVLT